jgi:hypothetical protein
MKRLVLVSVLLTLAASIAMAAPPTTADLLRLVPEGAQAIVAIDSAALRTHPAVQTWLARQRAWAATDEKLKRFLDDAGLDPVRDVDLLVLAALGSDRETTGVALLVGRYDPTALGAALTARGASSFALAGVPAFRLPDSGHHGSQAVLAQRSPELVIVGDEAAVTAAYAAPHAVSPLIAGDIAAGNLDLHAPFWMVAAVPAGARRQAGDSADQVHGEGSDSVRGMLLASGTVQKVIAQAYLGDSLRFVVAAVADTAENAGLLRDAAKGALAAMRLHLQESAPDLVEVLRNIDLRADGTVVSGKGSIPLALLEKLAAHHKAGHEGEKL